MIKTGIIIPFYGGSAYLPKLLSSIFTDNEWLDIRVYIIDNSIASEQLNRESIRFNNVVVINTPSGIGYGKACNFGYRKCIEENRELLFVVNQDGYFAKGALKKMIDSLYAADQYTAAVPLLTEYKTDQVEAFFTHVYLSPMTDLVSDLFAGNPKPYYQIQDLCGACFALKLKDYKQVPYLFDELFVMYFEDGDLYHRLTKMSKQVMIVPSAIFHHNHTNTKDELQTISSLAVKRTSKHIYILKNTGRSFEKALAGWALLEVRTIVEYLLKLKFRNLLVEIISCVKLFGKLIAVRESRKSEMVMITG